MIRTREGIGLGWLPDHPDFRDFTTTKGTAPEGETRDVPGLLSAIATQGSKKAKKQAPGKMDLRDGFSPVEDQGQLGSCTANAGVGLLEYFERTASGRHIDASRLFLYKATRNLMGETGDTGAYLRTTMQALVLFGAPPEDYWPYDIAAFDTEPNAFCYSFGQSFRTVQYYRLDPAGVSAAQLLAAIKANLAAKLPAMFGFTVFSSYTQAQATGEIPLPADGDRRVGGHAVVACGYDDARRIKHTAANGPSTTGALMIRNSWGTGWGDEGYGWLPYDYLSTGLTRDWWSMIKSDWVDAGVFG